MSLASPFKMETNAKKVEKKKDVKAWQKWWTRCHGPPNNE